MKMRQIITGGMVVLLTIGSPHAWSHNDPNSNLHNWKHAWSNGWSHFRPHSKSYGVSLSNKRGSGSGWSQGSSSVSGPDHLVPEIDAASGTSALALLTGVLLLASERRRSKRS
jgi:hypothetical protein